VTIEEKLQSLQQELKILDAGITPELLAAIKEDQKRPPNERSYSDFITQILEPNNPLARLLSLAVPMSGTTLTATQDNTTQTLSVYQFPRVAASGGIMSVCRVNGELYINFVCNKRNMQMYNWSAGYTEAPPPGKNIKIIQSAKRTLETLLQESNGVWSEVKLDHRRFQQGFEKDGIADEVNGIDIDSFHTAVRELLEETGLNIFDFENFKKFPLFSTGTIGTSQGDAPGQTSNRNHQYMVFLGQLENLPPIQGFDDVGEASWIKLSDIERIQNEKTKEIQYIANGKPLSEYMLRDLEKGLKKLWKYFLAQASTYEYDGESETLFSDFKNLKAAINKFCRDNDLEKEKSPLLNNFLRYLEKERSQKEPILNKTYTGPYAQKVLDCLLDIAKYMTKKIDVNSFINDLNEKLKPIEEFLTSIMQERNMFTCAQQLVDSNPLFQQSGASEQQGQHTASVSLRI